MYPDWPQSSADLVPLPQIDGPTLAAFDFQGPQKIEFLEHVGEGLHAHVFKVRILGGIYALKIVSYWDFYISVWDGPVWFCYGGFSRVASSGLVLIFLVLLCLVP